MAWVYPNSAFEEIEDRLVVGLKSGNAQDGVPTAFEFETSDLRSLEELPVEFGQVGGDALSDLGLNNITAG